MTIGYFNISGHIITNLCYLEIKIFVIRILSGRRLLDIIVFLLGSKTRGIFTGKVIHRECNGTVGFCPDRTNRITIRTLQRSTLIFLTAVLLDDKAICIRRNIIGIIRFYFTMLFVFFGKTLVKSKVHISQTVTAGTGIEEVELLCHPKCTLSYDPTARVSVNQFNVGILVRRKHCTKTVLKIYIPTAHDIPDHCLIKMSLNLLSTFLITAVPVCMTIVTSDAGNFDFGFADFQRCIFGVIRVISERKVLNAFLYIYNYDSRRILLDQPSGSTR